MNKKMKNRVMNHSTKFNQQQGVSTLLFTVLVGVSLTALSVGYISSLKTVQNSATTLHAQTQAQMQSMIGLNALNKFLSEQPLSNIQQIKSGNIKTTGVETIKFEMVSSNARNFVFDITGTSGGATSILRTSFTSIDEIVTKTQTGSVFAGGLQVNSENTIKGDGVTIKVKDKKIVDNSGTTINSKLSGITVEKYERANFVSADDLKSLANYIFSGADLICKQKNLYVNGTKDNSIIAETSLNCDRFSGVEYKDGEWIIDPSKEVPVGVLWFKEKVTVSLKKDHNKIINTIISQTGVTSAIPNGNTKTNYYAYSPLAYALEVGGGERVLTSDQLLKVCGTGANIPSTYCTASGQLKSKELLMQSPANIGNILYLTNGLLELDSGNLGSDNGVFFFGNLIASAGAGGPGMASGKFVGTGNIEIKGNMVVTGETNVTKMNGNIKLSLSNTDSVGSNLPSIEKSFVTNGIRYM